MIALIDGNNFYASCERIFRYDYRKRPLVVLSNNDGCVIARSNEAKELGIKMGEPYFKIKHFENTNGLVVCSANFVLYGDISNRVNQIVRRYCDTTEVYSVDESFLFLDGHSNIIKKMYQLREEVFKSLDLPTSIGIAPTKTLAKLANKIAKKYPEKTHAVYCINTQKKLESALKWFPIEDIWGIGKRYSEKFKHYHIRNAWDFINIPDDFLRKEMGIHGIRMKKELLGKRQYNLSLPEPKKMIATTRTFNKKTHEYSYVLERVSTFASECSGKLRNQCSCCQSVTVFITTDKFSNESQYSNSFTLTLPNPSNSSIEIAKYAKEALNLIFKENFYYKKAGVIVSNFTKETERTISLFDEDLYPKHFPLMQCIDTLNKKLGSQKIKLACMDIQNTWKMNQKHLSPKYSTSFMESIVLKA